MCIWSYGFGSCAKVTLMSLVDKICIVFFPLLLHHLVVTAQTINVNNFYAIKREVEDEFKNTDEEVRDTYPLTQVLRIIMCPR